jgi:hypothetical protein
MSAYSRLGYIRSDTDSLIPAAARLVTNDEYERWGYRAAAHTGWSRR